MTDLSERLKKALKYNPAAAQDNARLRANRIVDKILSGQQRRRSKYESAMRSFIAGARWENDRALAAVVRELEKIEGA